MISTSWGHRRLTDKAALSLSSLSIIFEIFFFSGKLFLIHCFNLKNLFKTLFYSRRLNNYFVYITKFLKIKQNNLPNSNIGTSLSFFRTQINIKTIQKNYQSHLFIWFYQSHLFIWFYVPTGFTQRKLKSEKISWHKSGLSGLSKSIAATI